MTTLYVLQVVDCGIPEDIPNAHWTGNTTYNSLVNYTCDTGYSAVGGNSRTCMATGNWSDISLVCSGKCWNHWQAHVHTVMDYASCEHTDCGHNQYFLLLNNYR